MEYCSKCKKHAAFLYTTTFDEKGNATSEGICIRCAYESDIPNIKNMLKGTGIGPHNIDDIAHKMDAVLKNNLNLNSNDVIKQMVDELNNMPEEEIEQMLNFDFLGMGDDEEDDDDDDFSNSTPTAVMDAESDDGAEDDDPYKDLPTGSFSNIFGKKSSRSSKKKEGKSRFKFLGDFGTNLTEKAQKGQIDRVIGRDVEIERVIQILNRRSKNNPVLIGEPGVGKTAVAQGLALRIAEKKVPEKILGMQVWQIDIPAMVAGTQFRGQFEQRIKGVINEAIKADNVILVIDELHMIMGAGDSSEGSTNAANILKPALARGELRILGSTTTSEYKRIEKDSALERRFQKVILDEPSVETAIEILKGIKDYYEKHHFVTYSDEVIEFAVKASKRYITDRFLPDKAIDLIDEAGSHANLMNVKLVKIKETKKQLDEAEIEQQKRIDEYDELSPTVDSETRNDYYKTLSEVKIKYSKLKEEYEALKNETMPDPVQIDDIAKVVEMWTGIPCKTISEDETQRLIHLEERLHERVIGQEEAVRAVALAVKRTRSGFTKKHKPTSFLFVGPTGVGKTELVKALTEAMFNTEDSLIRIDMSEYMESHSVSKLIGSPPGYVGHEDSGQLTEQVRRKPYSVVLFDEIEKAHADVYNLLLQLLDEGRLTDSHGVHVNFENTIIIMTSNAGNTAKAPTIGFIEDKHEALSNKIGSALKELFRPEFLNRIDETIIFNHLSKDEIRDIAVLMMKEVFASLEEKGISGSCSDAALDRLSEIGYDEKYGARPLRREIRRNVEDGLTDLYLSGKLKNCESVLIDYRDDEFKFDIKNKE
ncbi:MAG: ATP-dependent Clp protease ATP-binding subunit [Clostridia bacterium]|nr:ATP-dependent Clp protease ATP-binding subunit [Clostridia bacterium]